MNTDELIRQLARDPVVHWPFQRAFTVALAGGLAMTTLIYVALVGARPDVLQAAGTTRFLFKFVVTLSTALTAIVLIARRLQPRSPVGIAATFYAPRCSDDSPLFVAIWYPLASTFVIAVGYTIGARMLRW